jgi:type VI secretion system secreted protein Hcp
MTVKTSGRMLASVILAAMSGGCVGDDAPAQDADLVGTATFALMGVPADGTCVELTAAGNRTVKRAFDAPAGSSMVFPLGGLPVGSVTFTAVAFGSSCATRASMEPNWVSDASFTTTIAVSPPALVTLNLVRNGRASVSVTFDDDAAAPGDDGGASGGGASGGSPGDEAVALSFLQLDGIVGESTEKDLPGAFDLEDFQLAETTTVSTTGAVTGRAQWASTATMKFQKGAPDVYGAATTGRHLKDAVITVKKKKGDSKTIYYVVKLTNVLVSSVQSGGSGDVPDLTVGLSFASVEVTFRGGQNPDGTPMAMTTVNWDLRTSSGTSPSAYPFDFIVGGPAVAPVKAITAFHAPSEQTPTSATGGGTVASRPRFTDASIGLLVDADVLGYLAAAAGGRRAAMGSVEIDATDAGGSTPFGKYGFKNLLLHGVTLSGLGATVTFAATAYSWSTFGPDGKTTTFDTVTGKTS